MIRRQGLRTTSNGDLSKKLGNVSAEKRNRVEQTNASPIVSSWMLDVTRVFTSFDYTVCLLSSYERIDFLRDRYDPRYYTQSLLVAFYDKQGILWTLPRSRPSHFSSPFLSPLTNDDYRSECRLDGTYSSSIDDDSKLLCELLDCVPDMRYELDDALRENPCEKNCREKKREPSVLEGSCREACPVDPLNELPDEEDEEDEDEDDDDDNDNDDDDDK
uniref:Uncharacterized protein n=1 Tax=Vespula pensylvanica TaxID=30213 RepID=A0A834P3Y6_VESPE|nr:hypothetical protein H0235_007021 [Vespula pensylvanica]